MTLKIGQYFLSASMAETENIARMAEILSEDILGVFGWRRTGPVNLNWSCVTSEHRVVSHPSDVVFYYEEPYINQRTYVNIDLKSFSSKSITKTAISAALQSLVCASGCANNSEQWQRWYVDPGVNAKTVGLLFLYNHDDQYPHGLEHLIGAMDEKTFDLSVNNRIYIFDPLTISYLYTVATDIIALRGRNEIPASDSCRFFYPDLIQARARRSVGEAATLEALTGPWQIMHYRRQVSEAHDGGPGDGYLVYYRGIGDTVRDFHYLIDHLCHYQMLGENVQIQLRMPFAHREAAAVFERAIASYVKIYKIEELVTRLKRIKFRTVQAIRSKFSDVEIGMRNE